ncbi:MAG: hypothetical protein LIP09_06165 [Bacteroidales bacterium]|nr:hypothetical protein [Bacteroidales bacterium]
MASVFDWIAAMRRLNCNKHKGAVAPHKPILLFAVMAEIERGAITNCFVPLTEQMKRAFEAQWRLHRAQPV